MGENKARIHSVETFGTVDGPGIRYVVFFQGCALRCLYCHNRDTWDGSGGREVTANELLEDIKQYRDFYLPSGGGVTASGGEPTLQSDFLKDFFVQVRELGLTTALDTSGCIYPDNLKELLEVTDLVLLDIKHIDPDKYRRLTGGDNKSTLAFARYLAQQGKPFWVRYVLVPGYTDDPEDIKKLAAFLSELNSLERVEVLPYHTMGSYKWSQMGFEYTLENTQPPKPEEVAKVKEIFTSFGLKVKK